MPSKQDKPEWPYARRGPRGEPGIRMSVGGNGQWVKRIRGKLLNFGVLADPAAAFNRYQDEARALHAGKTPDRNTLTVQDLVDEFLEDKLASVERGELSSRTYADYRNVCRVLRDALGANRDANTLGPADFATVAGRLTSGPVRRTNELIWIRSIFNWARPLLKAIPDFGPAFVKPPERLIRKARRQQGEKRFTAKEVRSLIDSASVPLRAMILLGINIGYGNTDCAMLPLRAINWDDLTIHFPRPKTEIERMGTIWPETAWAIREWLKRRPEPSNPADAQLAFLTQRGQPWVRHAIGERSGVLSDAIGEEFGKLCKRLAINGRSFYHLRHTFETVADAARDAHALDRIQGHKLPGMRGVYVEHISIHRIRSITDFVYLWLTQGAAFDAWLSSQGAQWAFPLQSGGT